MKLLSLLLLTVSTLASFNGKWSGEGYYFTHRSEGPCKEVFLRLIDEENVIKLAEGGYVCGYIQAEYPFSKFLKVGEVLIYNGDEVGTYKNGILDISYYDGLFRLRLEKTSDGVLYKEEWKENDSFMVIDSKLSKLVE